jgi:hypothetical protein
MDIIHQIIRSDLRTFSYAVFILIFVDICMIAWRIILGKVISVPRFIKRYFISLLIFFNLLYVSVYFVSTVRRYQERLIPAQEMIETGTDEAVQRKRSQYGGK